MSNERSARSHESVDSSLSKGDVRSFFPIVIRLSDRFEPTRYTVDNSLTLRGQALV